MPAPPEPTEIVNVSLTLSLCVPLKISKAEVLKRLTQLPTTPKTHREVRMLPDFRDTL